MKQASATTAPAPRIARFPSGTARPAGRIERESIAAISAPPRLAPSIITMPSSAGIRPRLASAAISRIAATLEWNSHVVTAAIRNAVTGSPDR